VGCSGDEAVCDDETVAMRWQPMNAHGEARGIDRHESMVEETALAIAFLEPLRHVQAGTCRARANQEAARPYRVRFMASECLVTRVFHSLRAWNCSIVMPVIVGCTYPSLIRRPMLRPAKHTRLTSIRTRPADWLLVCPCSLPSEQFPDAHLVYHSSPSLSLLHLIQFGNLI
jgi:hypothetical protein